MPDRLPPACCARPRGIDDVPRPQTEESGRLGPRFERAAALPRAAGPDGPAPSQRMAWIGADFSYWLHVTLSHACVCRQLGRRFAHNGSVNRFLRYLWAGPTTLIGIALACVSLRRGHLAIVDGVIEAHGPFLNRALALFTPLARGVDAMTLGHVVIGRDARALELTRAHERVHVRQYELWGPLFVPAYLLAGICALMHGGHPYFDNRFEREARQAECD